jgi:RNA polymerase sigma factor (TIGR02999 family)
MSHQETNPRKWKANRRPQSFDIQCGLGPWTFGTIRESNANLMTESSTVRILTDYARSRKSHKRGDGVQPVSLDEEFIFSEGRSADVVALDEALTQLEQLEPRMSRVVELRFFVGLTVEETAEVLKLSPFTVHRDWRFAKAWLHRFIQAEGMGS